MNRLSGGTVYFSQKYQMVGFPTEGHIHQHTKFNIIGAVAESYYTRNYNIMLTWRCYRIVTLCVHARSTVKQSICPSVCHLSVCPVNKIEIA